MVTKRARAPYTYTNNDCFVVVRERCAGKSAPVIFIEMQRFTRTKALVEVKQFTYPFFTRLDYIYQIVCMVGAL